MFGRHAISVVWDFAESAPLGDSTGGWSTALNWLLAAIEGVAMARLKPGEVAQKDAADTGLPDQSAAVWFTDPPYYDNIPYSDLSDFFFVWLKRTLRREGFLRDPFDSENPLTPKVREAVWNRAHLVDGKAKDPAFFERTIAKCCAEGRRVLLEDGIGGVVFAHKTTEGWEALLSGIVEAGWSITASWPIATEMATQVSARESASLASSIHLVCRPRAKKESIGDWAEIFQELPHRIGDWMERLSAEGVRGADLVFACIGPAMELYSRYSKVEDAEGRRIPLGGEDPEAAEPYKRGFLAYVWEIVGRLALEQILGTAEARARNGAAGALEEDARLTALFLWTIQSTAVEPAVTDDDGADADAEDDDDDGGAGKSKKGLTLVYDVARRFAQPLGIHLDRWENRIIETKKGIVRMLPIIERAEQLLGEDGAIGVADLIERTKGKNINYEFAFASEVDERPSTPKAKTDKDGAGAARDEAPAPKQGTTTLDHVHIAMLLQKSGKSNALRTLLKSEIERAVPTSCASPMPCPRCTQKTAKKNAC
jgi:putative DNA methylase